MGKGPAGPGHPAFSRPLPSAGLPCSPVAFLWHPASKWPPSGYSQAEADERQEQDAEGPAPVRPPGPAPALRTPAEAARARAPARTVSPFFLLSLEPLRDTLGRNPSDRSLIKCLICIHT